MKGQNTHMDMATAQRVTTLTTLTTLTTNNNITHYAPSEQQCLDASLSETSFGTETSSPKSQGAERGVVISEPKPPEWSYVKLDLFDNATLEELTQGRRRLKLNVSILRATDGKWIYARASLNGPWRNVKRGLDFDDPEQRGHYYTLKTEREELIATGLIPNSSKCYLKGATQKGSTILGLSVIVCPLPAAGEYLACVIYQRGVYRYHMTSQHITQTQLRAGIICSTQTQRTITHRPRAQDLFK
jgi:hypothetical protein